MKKFFKVLAALLIPVQLWAGGKTATVDNTSLLQARLWAGETTATAEKLDAANTSVVSVAAPVAVATGTQQNRKLMDKTWIYLIDGDTISYGERGRGLPRKQMRIAGIDTPEVHHYSAGKFEDQAYGPDATKAGREIIKAAKKVEYIDLGKDKYGRTLVYVFVDDKLYAVEMLKRGLAYEYITAYGDNGYPEIGAAILDAAAQYPRKDFEYPHDWRTRVWSPENEAAELEADLAKPRIKMDKAQIIYDDGDTITYQGEIFRFVTIDTPEITHVEDGIMEDQPYGREAAAFTEKLFKEANTLEYISLGKDKYGRTLALFFVDGKMAQEIIVKAGLAYESVSIFGASGVPGYARTVLAAFKSMPKPPFENPMYWRKEHQVKP
ncbi:MAG: hypothetical protein A2021_07085 [Elusimicrobia bacterium GWF2_52_66]|nr:MAG: hypothetical protein A2X33_09560 [Elusimicrobia bacterium GWA2_51_34]OGR87479.1 MAG: hypothetical protein A2021_07085 [Elusimicrobia bacterium GWF2_52_66]HAF94573.1 hypothetical protein [Elusimicrobiota bacterium]HCE98093.1 hypothetical protein [Elusimicrobiota bacterium]